MVQVPSSPRPWFFASAVAAGIVVAIAATTFFQADGPGDKALSEAAKAQRIVAFQSKGALALPVVAADERSQALNQMALKPQDRQALERDLEANKTQLAWLTLWDDQVEDGDVISVSGEGFARTIALTKQQQKIAVPIGAGTSFLVKGLRDGGGGITVAATADGQAVPLPVIETGQSLQISIRGQ